MIKFIAIILTTLLVGCSTFKNIEKASELNVNTVEICAKEEFIKHERPESINMLPVKFFVITNPDDTIQFFTTNEAGVLITIKNYENLGLNMQEVLRYIRQSNDLLDIYEEKSDIIVTSGQ